DYIKNILLKFASLIDHKIQGPDEKVALEVIEKFHGLPDEVGISNNLMQLGIEEKEIPAMAHDLVKKYYRVKNPRTMNEEESRKLLECMWEGKLERIS
ncbi:MAG TPA: iron-containing alcohol dehydrogenase, partial [Clostridia bacterium]|nr:iron-containing alcohol dehydrogenase [Clostridia bacterium]